MTRKPNELCTNKTKQFVLSPSWRRRISKCKQCKQQTRPTASEPSESTNPPSQTKFDGLDNLTLDIQSTSSRLKPMFLNRPLIMLLEHLGVAPDAISHLQQNTIQEVQAIQNSLNQATKVFLQHTLGASFHLPSLFNNISK